MTWKYINNKWNISFWINQGQDLFKHKFKEVKFKVKRVYEKWHNFLIRYQNYKLLGLLEILLQGLCDSTLKIGSYYVFCRYKGSLCWSRVFLSIYGKVKEVLFDLGFLSLWWGEEGRSLTRISMWTYMHLGFEGINL